MLRSNFPVLPNLASSLQLLYTFASLLLLQVSTAILIPEPNGQYAVAVSTIKLVDRSRVDPYDRNLGYRNVMTSLFYPVGRDECEQMCAVPYMPSVTASRANAFAAELAASYGAEHRVPNITGTFGNVQLQVCCKPSTKASNEATGFPLVLFSPGLENTRLLYNALAQKLASAGYAVVTLDSTFETIVVEYPDGTYTRGFNTSYWIPNGQIDTQKLDGLLGTRIADARFVLTQFGVKDVVETLIPGATNGFNTTRAGIYGHSFGGATAVGTLMADERIVGAMNLDGAQYGRLYNTSRPVLLSGRAEPSSHNRTDDATWQKTWGFLKGWRRELGIRNIEHVSYGDAPLLVKLGGWPVNEGINGLIGTLDGQRAFDVQTTYIQAFMDLVLKGKRSTLLDGPSDAYPEVVVGDSNN